jgi:hypothetical protein
MPSTISYPGIKIVLYDMPKAKVLKADARIQKKVKPIFREIMMAKRPCRILINT